MPADFSQQSRAASSALDFFQRHPLNPSPELIHVRRRPSAQLALATETRKSIPSAPLNLDRPERLKDDLSLLTDQVHSTLLLRMVGATLPTSMHFAMMLLILMHSIIYILTKRIAVRFILMAIAASAHFLVLPFFTSALIHHTPSFKSFFSRCTSRLLSSPMTWLAIWLQARLFVAFAACLFSAFELDMAIGDMSVAALTGVCLLCLDVGEGQYVCTWSKIILQGCRKKRLWARDAFWMMIGVTASVLFLDAVSVHVSPAALSLLRISCAFFLSPSPSLGFAMIEDTARIPRFLSRLALIFISSLWLQQWRDKSQAETERALLSKSIATPGDLLLAMNSSSMVDQLIVNAHILSATEDAPNPLPVTTSVTFVESDFAQHEKGVSSTSIMRSTVAVPHKGPVGLHWGRNCDWPSLATRTTDDGTLLKNAHALPYKIGRALSSCLIPLLSSELKTALAIMISESSGESYFANLILYCLVPNIFEGRTPNAYSAEQVKILTGRTRPTFLSVFGTPEQIVLSPEAAALTFGDQLFVSLMSRQEILVASLQQLFFVTEIIQVTPPTGSFLPRAGNPKQQLENVFRYDPVIRTEISRCLSDLNIDLTKSDPIFKSLAQEKTAGKWLIFGDGSIGLVKPDRQALLTACQELLMVLVPQFLMATEAVCNVSRVMQQVAPLDASNASTNNQTQPWTNLRKYFPSADFDAPAAAEGPQYIKLRSIVARAMTLSQMARDFAIIPINPPYSISVPDLTSLATQLSIYLERWIKSMSAMLSITNIEAERLVTTRAEVRRILAKR